MRASWFLTKEKIINFICLISLLGLIFPQTAESKTRGESWREMINPDLFMARAVGSNGLPEVKDKAPKKTVYLAVTAYSSSKDECDADPFTTASGSRVNDGTIAHNYLPFGTKVRFPEVYGKKIFTVEDRLAPTKGFYIADMWKPSKQEAKQWGVKHLKMEII